MLEKLKNIRLSKMGKSFLIGLTGAVLMYVTQWATGQDFGFYTPLITALLSVLANFFKEWAVAPKAAAAVLLALSLAVVTSAMAHDPLGPVRIPARGEFGPIIVHQDGREERPIRGFEQKAEALPPAQSLLSRLQERVELLERRHDEETRSLDGRLKEKASEAVKSSLRAHVYDTAKAAGGIVVGGGLSLGCPLMVGMIVAAWLISRKMRPKCFT